LDLLEIVFYHHLNSQSKADHLTHILQ